jgi:prolipoprotein diacylglyceryl transferase
MLQFITWNIDPELVKIGPLSVRYYGVMFACAFICSYYVFARIFRKENLPIEHLDKLTMMVVLGTIIGARIGHCLFYEAGYFLSHPFEMIFPFRGKPGVDFEFTGYQGLSSHGGALGILTALYLFLRKHDYNTLWLLDRMGIVVSFSAFFIRMGNLFNSEIYGVETSMPWGFIFLQRDEVMPKHPTQLYEGLSYLAIFAFLHTIYNRTSGKFRPGLLFGIFLTTIFTARILIELIKENQVGFEENMILNMGQILSIPFALAGIGMLIYVLRKKDTHTTN